METLQEILNRINKSTKVEQKRAARASKVRDKMLLRGNIAVAEQQQKDLEEATLSASRYQLLGDRLVLLGREQGYKFE